MAERELQAKAAPELWQLYRPGAGRAGRGAAVRHGWERG